MEIQLKKGAYAAAAETMGGELVSLRDRNGRERIWQGDPAVWSGRNPNLFPIVGGLRNGEVDIDGTVCRMGRHGFARRKEFSVAERGEDYVVLALREDAETLEQYPFPFLFQVRHQLTETGFVTSFTVTNTGERPMPFCIGAHTAFICPVSPEEAFADYRLIFDEPETADAVLPGPDGCLLGEPGYALRGDAIPLDYGYFDRMDTLIFQGLRSRGVKLVNRAGQGVRMDFPDFPMIAFWTKPGAHAPYLCIEPWHGCAAYTGESGRFRDKPGCMVLEPGQTRALAYTVTILE